MQFAPFQRLDDGIKVIVWNKAGLHRCFLCCAQPQLLPRLFLQPCHQVLVPGQTVATGGQGESMETGMGSTANTKPAHM